MRFEGGRARDCYDASAPLFKYVSPSSRPSLWVLRQTYLRLLARIEREKYSVLSRRINVPTRSKVVLLIRAFLR